MESSRDRAVKFSDAITGVAEQTLRGANEVHEKRTKEFWDGWHERRRARQRKYVQDQRVGPVTISYKETPFSILSPALRDYVTRKCKAEGIRIDEVTVINSTTVEFP